MIERFVVVTPAKAGAQGCRTGFAYAEDSAAAVMTRRRY